MEGGYPVYIIFASCHLVHFGVYLSSFFRPDYVAIRHERNEMMNFTFLVREAVQLWDQ